MIVCEWGEWLICWLVIGCQQGEIASQPERRGMFPATWVRMINLNSWVFISRHVLIVVAVVSLLSGDWLSVMWVGKWWNVWVVKCSMWLEESVIRCLTADKLLVFLSSVCTMTAASVSCVASSTSVVLKYFTYLLVSACKLAFSISGFHFDFWKAAEVNAVSVKCQKS